ncbi:50S ribosomal protein L15 [candidate division NPL-UPA2 bacterium]|nr:50S ribosomal protein L15 [candidate division NPL-UPA2 bacterium]
MNLSQLKSSPDSEHRRKRIGRGPGSGHGKTSGRGQKGSGARRGGGVRSGFEGGQTPLTRRVPKRGFTHQGREYTGVNVGRLNKFDEKAEVAPENLRQKGIIKGRKRLIKILGEGELTKRGLRVSAHRFSKEGQRKIEELGGTAEVIEHA